MIKTFKGFASDRELTVKGYDDGSQVELLVMRSATGLFDTGIAIAPSDAPAIALAILEAAGGRDSLGIDVGNAMTDLREYVTEQERATAEARERAELEAEALELLNAYRKSFLHCAPEDDFDGFDDPEAIKAKWLAVARRAREMRAEK